MIYLVVSEKIHHQRYIHYQQIYDNREDLAEIVIKIDYLLEYTSACIRQKDFNEAKETIKSVESRMNTLDKEGVDMEHLKHLYEGIKKKCK